MIVSENNSLKAEIEELVGLCKQLENESKSEFFEAATEEEMSDWEKKNHINIPDSYKEWLRFSNGAIITGTTAIFYGIDRFVLSNETMPEEYVVIGMLVGDGEILCFSKKTGEFIWYDHGREERYDDFKAVLNEIMDMM